MLSKLKQYKFLFNSANLAPLWCKNSSISPRAGRRRLRRSSQMEPASENIRSLKTDEDGVERCFWATAVSRGKRSPWPHHQVRGSSLRPRMGMVV